MSVSTQLVDGFKDCRADRFFDIFPHISGQITISNISPNQFSGWHRHKLQYDIFFVSSGNLKVAIISPDGEVKEFLLNSDRPQTVFIPSNYWHCYKSGGSPATLIYFLSKKHNEDDEYRASEVEIFKQYGYKV